MPVTRKFFPPFKKAHCLVDILNDAASIADPGNWNDRNQSRPELSFGSISSFYSEHSFSTG